MNNSFAYFSIGNTYFTDIDLHDCLWILTNIYLSVVIYNLWNRLFWNLKQTVGKGKTTEINYKWIKNIVVNIKKCYFVNGKLLEEVKTQIKNWIVYKGHKLIRFNFNNNFSYGRLV